MAEIVAGHLLKPVLSKLLKAVVDVAKKSKEFKPLLERLESTLKQITPRIENIESLNRDLDHDPADTEMYAEKLEKGRSLVLKCASVRSWNFWQKYSHAKKLIALDNELVRLVQVFVPLDTLREVMILRVSNGNGGLVGICGVPEVCEAEVVGLEEPVRIVKEMVVRSGGEKVVVVTAPGGCGKTTLAQMVCGHEDVKGMFKDNIFFVVVSQTPNLSNIIEKLFQHKGLPVPKFQTDDDAINQSVHMLKKIGPNPILLVLDDVWSGLDTFILRLQSRIPEIKILVTSRSDLPKFKSTTYKLEPLNPTNATALFLHSATPQSESSYIPDEDLVKTIVKGCRGCPLALEVVGRSLCGKPAEIWEQKRKQFEGASLFSSASNNDILKCLLTSVNSLDEVLKECYLDLASFPEDKRIPESTLIDMWVGLHDLDEDGDAVAFLQELSMLNLVDLVVSRKEATQHDLLRELAIHLCDQEDIEKRKRLIIEIKDNKFLGFGASSICEPIFKLTNMILPYIRYIVSSSWIQQGQPSICACLVSLSTDESFSSNWPDLQLPKVEVLVLNIKSRNYTLPQFMEKMKQLKVLIITNYGFFSSKIQSIPVLCGLSNLKRIRFERVLLSSINDSVLNLRNLQKISFIMCEISEAFRRCTIQAPNMLPNLLEIVIDYCSDLVEFPAFLGDIRSLEKLSITNCHELVTIAEEFERLDNLKLLRLHACTKLSKLPDTIGSLKKLEFLDMSECIGIRELPSSIKDLEKLKKVRCDEKFVDQWQKLKNLKIEVHKEEPSLEWLH